MIIKSIWYIAAYVGIKFAEEVILISNFIWYTCTQNPTTYITTYKIGYNVLAYMSRESNSASFSSMHITHNARVRVFSDEIVTKRLYLFCGSGLYVVSVYSCCSILSVNEAFHFVSCELGNGNEFITYINDTYESIPYICV